VQAGPKRCSHFQVSMRVRSLSTRAFCPPLGMDQSRKRFHYITTEFSEEDDGLRITTVFFRVVVPSRGTPRQAGHRRCIPGYGTIECFIANSTVILCSALLSRTLTSARTCRPRSISAINAEEQCVRPHTVMPRRKRCYPQARFQSRIDEGLLRGCARAAETGCPALPLMGCEREPFEKGYRLRP
jgi:hypothetical protein